MDLPGICGPKARVAAFTLAEVVMCVCIMMVLFAAIFTSYIQTSYRAEWSGYSLAAQALAIQQLEQAKSAVWDTQQTPVKNEMTNLLLTSWATLDLPVSGTNYVYATNYSTLTLIPTAVAGVSNYMLKVNTVWPFRWKGQTVYFTNTIADYFAPE
jgi:Tfp pilus assembly protein PilE